jgi:hypothetical protein
LFKVITEGFLRRLPRQAAHENFVGINRRRRRRRRKLVVARYITIVITHCNNNDCFLRNREHVGHVQQCGTGVARQESMSFASSHRTKKDGGTTTRWNLIWWWHGGMETRILLIASLVQQTNHGRPKDTRSLMAAQ